jgi:hypothetical protein
VGQEDAGRLNSEVTAETYRRNEEFGFRERNPRDGSAIPQEQFDELVQRHDDEVAAGSALVDELGRSAGQSKLDQEKLRLAITGIDASTERNNISANKMLEFSDKKNVDRPIDLVIADIKKVVANDARQPLPGGPGPQSMRTFAMGGALHTLISTHAIAKALVARMSARKVYPRRGKA